MKLSTRSKLPPQRLCALLAATLLAACNGGESSAEAEQRARAQAEATAAIGRVTVSTEPAGAACPAGGYRVTAWYDANANGTPDEGETASTGFVCNGAAGAAGQQSLVRTATEAAGARCANGGTRVDAGLDTNANGTLEDAEVTSTSHVCNGSAGAPAAATLFALATEPAGALCAAGGTRLSAGPDRNGNGALDADEVTASSVVCSGGTGPAGAASLVGVANEPAGANCPLGGTVVTTGLDRNANALLDADEVASTRYLCSATGATGAPGAPGATGRASLTLASSEPPGAQCATGGVKLSVGSDADGDGALSAAEISTTRYVCNGAEGAAGRASLSAITAEPAGANCSAGGSRLTSGLDGNGNGVLDTAEVTSTTYACNGSTGATGAAGNDGFASLVAVATEPPGAQCPAGGSRISAGVDANRNGVLDSGEVSSTAFACNGAAGAGGSNGTNGAAALTAVEPEDPGTNCTAGGSRITAGLDLNANGTLDSAEVTSSAYVCNGASNGLTWTPVATGTFTMQANRSYVAQTTAARLRFTLPANPVPGDTVRVVGAGSAGWEIVPAAGQWVDTSVAGADSVALDSVMRDFRRAMPMGLNGACTQSADGEQLFVADTNMLRYSSNGGRSYTETNLSGNWSVAAWSGDGSTLLVGQYAGSNGILQRWTNDFRRVQTLPLTGSLRDAALSRDGRVMLVAASNSGFATGALSLSTDHGATWTTVGPDDVWRSVAVSEDGRVLLAGSQGPGSGDFGRVMVSTNGGLSWRTVVPNEATNAVALTPSGQDLFAAGGTLRRSRDGGTTWQTMAQPPVVGNLSSIDGLRVSASGQQLVALMGPGSENTNGRAYRSDDGGASWTALPGTVRISQGSGCLAITRDGGSLLLNGAPDALLSVPTAYAPGTAIGSDGLLRADQYALVELQYLGSGRWALLNHRGRLYVR